MASGDDIQVSLADQQKINRFSRLNLRMKELDLEIETMKNRVRTCKDALEEAEMCLDPEGMLLTVGESFFQVSEEEAVEYLEKATRVSEEFLEKYTGEYSTLRAEMDELKKSLYGKFGSAINLEDK